MNEAEAIEAMAPKDDDEHAAIWLEPKCSEQSADGRSWCQDDVWNGVCDDCGASSVKYLRADLVYKRFGELMLELDAQFAAGAEAMREACLREADPNNELGCGCEICCGRRAALTALESNIRALPIPARGDGGNG